MDQSVDCYSMLMKPYELMVTAWKYSDERWDVVERVPLESYIERAKKGDLSNPKAFFLGIPPCMSQIFLLDSPEGMDKGQKKLQAAEHIDNEEYKHLRLQQYFYASPKVQISGESKEWLVYFNAVKMQAQWIQLYRLHGSQLYSNFSAFTLQDSLERQMGGVSKDFSLIYRDKLSFVFLHYLNNQLVCHLNLGADRRYACPREKWKDFIKEREHLFSSALYLVDEPTLNYPFELTDFIWEGQSAVVSQDFGYQELSFHQLGLINPRMQWNK